MTERPILFSAPMVRAILNGRKTQTRRVIKPQPEIAYVERNGGWLEKKTSTSGNVFLSTSGGEGKTEHGWLKCPYGQAGDRLWVRETFSVCEMDDGSQYAYRATGDKIGCLKWKPSIFMPRLARRITLEVTSVRVERLQDISDADALAEGVDQTNTSIGGYATERCKQLWKSINGPESWSANPWVWVIEFKRVQP